MYFMTIQHYLISILEGCSQKPLGSYHKIPKRCAQKLLLEIEHVTGHIYAQITYSEKLSV